MTSSESSLSRYIGALRRRRVLTTAGLYVVGAWLVMQAADVFFPGWGIPDSGINVLLVAAILGFPVALLFGWFFNITGDGIRRTMPAGPDGVGEPRPLRGSDYLVLGALVVVSGVIVSYATVEILAMQGEEPPPPLAVEKLPNSIAVLPFDNISTDPENEVFSDGVSEEIRNRLGQYGELQVLARTSSFQFKGSDYGIPRISALLGAQYLLLGSVRRQGNRIRVSAQLVADKGTQLWSENYDRVLEDIFDIQDEIADLVAAEVAPQIVARRGSSYTPSLDAYEHFLKGRDLFHRRDRVAARDELAMAIDLDPAFAEAQAEYALSLLIGYPDEQSFRKAEAAIAASLRHSPGLPRALAARGLFLSQQSPPDLNAAETALREALRRDPNMVDAMNWLGGVLSRQGRDSEAHEWMERAYGLDPLNGSVATNMANRYWEEGDLDRAESIWHRLVDLPEPSVVAFTGLSEFYVATGRLVEDNRLTKRLLLSGSWNPFYLARNYAMLGKFQSAAHWMAFATRENPELIWVRTGWVQAQPPCWEGDYGQAATEMRQARAANGISLEQSPPVVGLFYGISQALAGDFDGAIDTLGEALPRTGDRGIVGGDYEVDAYQAFAWSYSRKDMPEESRQLLEAVEQWFARKSGSVKTASSTDLYEAARNAAMMGDNRLALERLERAVEAGWRGYYVNDHDPRWGALKDHPRYQALMAEVKADVDRQRTEVERIDAEKDSPALPD